MAHENYEYWQAEGAGWYEEYTNRKMHIPYFHFQEIFISEMVSKSAPVRVLEYGCGVGRHLKNLVNISGASIYGYDQSPTMVAEMLNWTTQEWIDDHVHLGEAIPTLPYEDGFFDIVYTSEVLVHVCPEDVPHILKELLRVSRGIVFHFEPGPEVELDHGAHGGCWGHDIQKIYEDLGVSCKKLPKLFKVQDILLVEIDKERGIAEPFSEVTSSLFRKMEQAFEPLLLKAIDNTCELRLQEAQRKEGYLTSAIEFNEWLLQEALNGSYPTSVRLEVLPADGRDEVWIRYAKSSESGPMMPWEKLGSLPENWFLAPAVGCMYDQALYGRSGPSVELPVGALPFISLMGHPWSSMLRITVDEKEWVLDLRRDETEIVSFQIPAKSEGIE